MVLEIIVCEDVNWFELAKIVKLLSPVMSYGVEMKLRIP
jgi:hypothetical protein